MENKDHPLQPLYDLAEIYRQEAVRLHAERPNDYDAINEVVQDIDFLDRQIDAHERKLGL